MPASKEENSAFLLTGKPTNNPISAWGLCLGSLRLAHASHHPLLPLPACQVRFSFISLHSLSLLSFFVLRPGGADCTPGRKQSQQETRWQSEPKKEIIPVPRGETVPYPRQDEGCLRKQPGSSREVPILTRNGQLLSMYFQSMFILQHIYSAPPVSQVWKPSEGNSGRRQTGSSSEIQILVMETDHRFANNREKEIIKEGDEHGDGGVGSGCPHLTRCHALV